jgi:hypothetical protein
VSNVSDVSRGKKRIEKSKSQGNYNRKRKEREEAVQNGIEWK